MRVRICLFPLSVSLLNLQTHGDGRREEEIGSTHVAMIFEVT